MGLRSKGKQDHSDVAAVEAAAAAEQQRSDRLRELEEQLVQVRADADAGVERYELMVQAAGIGLWDMDVVAHDPVNMDNVFNWSQEFRTMLGYRDRTDFPDVLSSWASRLHPEDVDRVVAAFLGHLQDRSGRIPYDIEYRLQLKTGEYRWFRATGATKRDRTGTPLRVAGALRDVDDEKRLIETSSAQVAQLTTSSSQLAGVSVDLQRAVEAAVGKAREAAATIADLDASSTKIGAVVQMITGIAAQTNMLALNATIEAARAGDAGRGFAVVANEVKELANETAQATREIATQVEEIRAQTAETVRSIGEIDATIQALASTQQAVDELVQAQR